MKLPKKKRKKSLTSSVPPPYIYTHASTDPFKNSTKYHKQIDTTMWCFLLAFVSLFLLSSIQGGTAEQCGRQAGGALCPGGQCCSKYGWCGTAPDYCSTGCQSQCGGGGGGGGGDIGSLVSRNTFNQMLKHRNDGGCPAKGFYTYDAFIAAAKSFPNFAKTGDAATQKREIAAFLAQTSHETTGQ